MWWLWIVLGSTYAVAGVLAALCRNADYTKWCRRHPDAALRYAFLNPLRQSAMTLLYVLLVTPVWPLMLAANMAEAYDEPF